MMRDPAPARRTAHWSALCLVAALTLLAGCGGQSDAKAKGGGGAIAPAPAKAIAVGVVALVSEPVPLFAELPGRTSAPMVAEIRPQVGGIVTARRFTEGGLVKAGQVLYQIDAASYRAAQDSAQAAVAKAEAVAESSRLTAERQAGLAKIDAVSQQDLQDAQAAQRQAQADLASARAALSTARINLSRTQITSPIAGQADVSTVTPGALVTAEQASALTTVRQLDPIQVEVTQSSADLLALKRALASGRLQRAGNDAQVSLLLEDGSTYAHSGRLSMAGVSVNASTGAVTLRAVFPNPEGLLMSGMYVRARVATAVATQGVLVPQQAVTRRADGTASVLLVDADSRVQRRSVNAERAVGNRWLVDQGLATGERVIVEGLQKVKPGDLVQAELVQPATATAAAPAPQATASAAASAPATR